jgi:hypothetical protein
MVSLFGGDQLDTEISEAPNPKPTAVDKSRFGSLASLYTAFSTNFAGYAIDLCLRAGYSTIADPFSGMGTLAEAARTRPVELILGDISPFAALSGAFRAAPSHEIHDASCLVESSAKRAGGDSEAQFFSFLLAKLAAGLDPTSVIRTPTSPEHRRAALSMYVAAISRIHLYKHLAGSNPTWIKRSDSRPQVGAALGAVAATISAVRKFARGLSEIDRENRTSSYWSGISSLPITSRSIDAIISSPPYANRTDYLRHYQPASELLLEAAGLEERGIRIQQIGTPLIRDSVPVRDFPKSVTNILERIRTHESYASERYYYKGFLYYFSDMQSAIERMHGWLGRNGLLLMVVQDAYYKDLHVPTATLLADIARSAGFRLATRREWPVRNSLSQLSPHSRRSSPNRTLSESLLALSK